MQSVNKHLTTGHGSAVVCTRAWLAQTRLQLRCTYKWTAGSRRKTYAGAAAEQAPVETAKPSVLSSRHGDLVWASCVTSQPSITAAVGQAVDNIHKQQPDGFEPDLAIVFASCNYGSQLQDAVKAIRRQVPSVRHVFGCSAFGVLGGSGDGPVEIEGEPGISLTLAALPGVEVSVMHTLRSSIPSEDASPEAWADLVGMSPLEQLQQSTPPSALASADDEEDGGEDGVDSDNDDAKNATGVEAPLHLQQQQQQQEEEKKQKKEGQVSQQQQQQSSGLGDVQKGGSEGQLKLDEAATAAYSQQQQQQQQRPSEAVSFLLLCDPRFQQSKQLLAGLDFAFPNSNKVGAVLSQGQQNKRRLMYVWSADGAVQTGTAAWRRKQQQRRQRQQQQLAASSSSSSTEQQQQQQQQMAAESAVEVQQQGQPLPQQQQQSPEDNSNGKRKGLFGSLFDSLLSGLNEDEEQRQQQQRPAGSSSSKAETAAGSAPAEFEVLGSSTSEHGDESVDANGDEGDEDEDTEESNGVFMYGAAVLCLKGPLVLEPVTCQGYRVVSDKVWTVGQTSRDGDLITTLIDPDHESDPNTVADGGGIAVDDEPGVGGEAEVAPLLAVYELMMSAGFDEQVGESLEQWIENLSSSLAVAIAPDSFKPSTELQQDDFQVCAISEVWQKTGYIRIDGQARPGYRLRLVLRDELGIRDDLDNKLLGLKRAELAGVLTGNKQPPSLGTLLFSDIGRGTSLYDTPSFESGTVSRFLSAPLSGMFGSAQISTVNKKAALYELASVVGVIRPLSSSSSSAVVAKQNESAHRATAS